MDAMVDSLVELEEEPLTNDPDAVGELLEVWDAVVDASPVEGDFEDRYDGGGVIQTLLTFNFPTYDLTIYKSHNTRTTRQ